MQLLPMSDGCPGVVSSSVFLVVAVAFRPQVCVDQILTNREKQALRRNDRYLCNPHLTAANGCPFTASALPPPKQTTSATAAAADPFPEPGCLSLVSKNVVLDVLKCLKPGTGSDETLVRRLRVVVHEYACLVELRQGLQVRLQCTNIFFLMFCNLMTAGLLKKTNSDRSAIGHKMEGHQRLNV